MHRSCSGNEPGKAVLKDSDILIPMLVSRLRIRGVRKGNNTLNICLGHAPFPASGQRHIDLMLSPREIRTAGELVVVKDSIYGENGSALSEYAQLFWLYDNLKNIASGYKFIRIFHYRRFISPTLPPVGTRANQWWSTAIQPAHLERFESAFCRSANQELANTPVLFPGGVLGQYADAHHLQDLLRFTEYLCERGLLEPKSAANFLRAETLIPACNIGIFRVRTFQEIYRSLRPASDFLESPLFTPRDGYQRRTLGFLLERFQSYLILQHMKNRGSKTMKFGYNMVISDTPAVSNTIYI